MEFQDQPVELRADANDDLPEDVHGRAAIGIDGALAMNARREEYVFVFAVRNEPDCKPPFRVGSIARVGNGTAPRKLSLSLGPDDRVHLALDDTARISGYRDLSFLLGLYVAKLVLMVESQHHLLVLHQNQRRLERHVVDVLTGPQL